MQAFKVKAFARWANREGLNDDALASAVIEMGHGLIDAKLGGQVVKKRVAMPGRGKRGSKELQALKLLAKKLLNYAAPALVKATNAGELIEIEVNDDG